MEIFQQRNQFLRKYVDQINWIQLSHNWSATEYIKNKTKDLPWQESKYTPKQLRDLREAKHTLEEQNNFNYIEFLVNPYYNWQYFKDDQLVKVPGSWIANYFFDNWSKNPSLLTCNKDDIIYSIRRYIAATRIQRTWRRIISDPSYLLCKRRLVREFDNLSKE